MLPVILFGLLAAVLVSGDEKPPEYSGSLESNSSDSDSEATVTLKNGWDNTVFTKSVGGKFHAPYKYPFVAGVGRQPIHPLCGGAIISVWHVLTVAHCTKDATSLVVTLGDYDRSGGSGPLDYIPVAGKYEHEQYDNSQGERHDICLLVLQWAITQSEHVGIVCMPTGPMDLVGEHVKIMSWGAMGPNSSETTLPHEVDLEVVDFDRCYQYYQYTNPGFQMCTFEQGKTICRGDSGSPVVYLNPETNRYVLVGLVSFGPFCDGNKPSVQTYIPAYLSWINDIIEKTTPGVQLCI